MIFSDNRKLALCGWLKDNHSNEYNTPIKLQKFLFLYEAFCKAENESYDFSHLKGYKYGPVFSNVWGDYTKERYDFDNAVESSYINHKNLIQEPRAEKCSFIISCMNEKELSDLTHAMHIWNSQQDRIMRGEYQVELKDSDFTLDDVELIKTIESMFPIEMIKKSKLIHVNGYSFVFEKSEMHKFTESHYDTLAILSENEELHNPVYVSFDDEGGLIID